MGRTTRDGLSIDLLIDREDVIFFNKIVKEHGGRTAAAEILDALPRRKPSN